MKTVRLTAGILYYLSLICSIIILSVTVYALAVVLLYNGSGIKSIPMKVADGIFYIFFPFTTTTFLLGDYTPAYLVSNLMTIAFYGLFLYLLAQVFLSFRQSRLFTKKGVLRLHRFYITNLVVPFLFLGLLAVFGEEILDIVRIILLHLVIGVFAFFMAAIFKQGLVLQEEQDLIF